jgi:hypothetical protein
VTLTVTMGVAVCSSSIANPYTSQNGSVSVTYSSSYISPSSGYNLTVQMPSSYSDDATNSYINPVLSVSQVVITSPNTYIF